MTTPTVSKVFQIPAGRMTKGDIGIEIEVEGRRLPALDKYWRATHDGSLKGPEAIEYVLQEPMTLPQVRKSLSYLESRYVECKTEVHDSVRAGVHVHVNVQQLSIIELYNFITLYLIFEELLVKFCGEHREGNLFCLRTSDAGFLLETLKRAVRTKKFMQLFHDDDLRYASMNVKALTTYGSLEFRSMRGTRDLDLIYTWAEILLSLREIAKTFENPSDILSSFSGAGPMEFLKGVFKEKAVLFKSFDNCELLINNGMRNAQDIAFCTNWDDLINPVRKNPFKQDVWALAG